jgi:hypothetical protein
VDNVLKACMDDRKAALDLRLLDWPMTDPGKIDTAAGRIAGLWQAHRDDIYPGRDVCPELGQFPGCWWRWFPSAR